MKTTSSVSLMLDDSRPTKSLLILCSMETRLVLFSCAGGDDEIGPEQTVIPSMEETLH